MSKNRAMYFRIFILVDRPFQKILQLRLRRGFDVLQYKVGRLEGLIVSYFSVWIDRSAPTDMHTDYRHPEIQTTYASILPLHLQSSNNKVEGRNSFAESFAVLSTEKASVKVDIALRCERN